MQQRQDPRAVRLQEALTDPIPLDLLPAVEADFVELAEPERSFAQDQFLIGSAKPCKRFLCSGKRPEHLGGREVSVKQVPRGGLLTASALVTDSLCRAASTRAAASRHNASP